MKSRINYMLLVGVGIFMLSALATASATQTIKEVSLTFDDGPYGTSTQEIIDILQKEKVPATFFLIGKNVEKYPTLAQEEVRDGYMVGNHTYDHPKNLTKMSLGQVAEELSKTEQIIASSTGVHTKLFRPPYGSITKKLRSKIQSMGYTIVLWNVDPQDWNYASSTSAVIEQNILTHLKNHMNIVLHDGRDTRVGYPRDNLITALPVIIQDLKQRGYTFVTADKLTF